MFIIVNALIKTLVLWFLILWISRKILRRPLSQMTAAVEGITMDQLDDFQMNLNTRGRNELMVLE
jgi:nitrate/nitrite-specific signal transduction histidine kinase